MSSQEETAAVDEQAAAQKALSDCLFDQFPFFLGGTALGTTYALSQRTKNYMPMLVGGLAGSAADLVYGYHVKCVGQVERATAAAAAARSNSNQSQARTPQHE